MSTSYSTALSHIILAGTGIYCYLGVNDHSLYFPQCSFGSIIVNSLLGVWRWGNPSYGRNSNGLYKFTSLLQDLLALPCIVSTELLQYGYMKEIAYAYTLVSVLPLITYICDNRNMSNDLLNTILGANCITLGVLSFLHQNYFGIAACVSYAFNHFLVRNDDETYFDIPSQDLYNYAMCFFAFFGLKTVLD
ncbi:uncharacterized protein [Leptinotarsa decemlineata]|uniref:uncharacterized protein n=1 Tax=Leptinotarsa decemlineata TaxID=7539 RepID=UPI000C2521F1|nr:uncharacterized protein LOC111505761 [Leptinotarsa decemlineata]